MSEQEIEQIAVRVAEILATKLDGRVFETITQTEAAKRLGVSRKTVFRMLEDGRLKEAGNGRVLASSLTDATKAK